jgi:hypothetical protein
MARFLFCGQKEFEPIRYIPTKFRRREVCSFFVAADSVSVLARQRVAQASQAEFAVGKSLSGTPDCALGMPRDLLRRLYRPLRPYIYLC